MPKEARILPDMLLTVFKKGYLCYLIALCYVIVALLSAFCLHCHTTKQRRIKRGLPMSCGGHCQECDLAGNGCLNCTDRTFLFTVQGSSQSMARCVAKCPESHYGYYSRIEPNTCKRCRIPRCASCDGAPSHCHECKQGFFLYKQNNRKVYCLRRCPKGFKKYQKKTCIPRKPKCTVSSWTPTKRRACVCNKGRWQVKFKTRTIKTGERKKCNKKLEKWRDCRPPRRATCHSSNHFRTNSHSHRRRGRHRLNDSRARKYSSNHRHREDSNNRNSNNYKTRNRRSTRVTNKRSIPSFSIVT